MTGTLTMAHSQSMREVRLGLFRRVLDHCRAGTTDLAPGVMRVPASAYFDAEVFARERQRLFRETPLLVCLSVDLPEVGSFRLFDDTGVPIIVTRSADGRVRAFLNVCVHRGGRMESEPCGRAKRFTCKYHGWTYDSFGKRIGVPSEAFFAGKIEDDRRLAECPAEEQHGMVFVLALPGGTMDLDAHLGALAQKWNEWSLAAPSLSPSRSSTPPRTGSSRWTPT